MSRWPHRLSLISSFLLLLYLPFFLRLRALPDSSVSPLYLLWHTLAPKRQPPSPPALPPGEWQVHKHSHDSSGAGVNVTAFKAAAGAGPSLKPQSGGPETEWRDDIHLFPHSLHPPPPTPLNHWLPCSLFPSKQSPWHHGSVTLPTAHQRRSTSDGDDGCQDRRLRFMWRGGCTKSQEHVFAPCHYGSFKFYNLEARYHKNVGVRVQISIHQYISGLK